MLDVAAPVGGNHEALDLVPDRFCSSGRPWRLHPARMPAGLSSVWRYAWDVCGAHRVPLPVRRARRYSDRGHGAGFARLAP